MFGSPGSAVMSISSRLTELPSISGHPLPESLAAVPGIPLMIGLSPTMISSFPNMISGTPNPEPYASS